MNASEYVDSVHENAYKLVSTAMRLEGIGYALETVGNASLSNDMLSTANTLRSIAKDLRDSLSSKLDDDIKQAHRTSETIMKAALAGATLANETKK